MRGQVEHATPRQARRTGLDQRGAALGVEDLARLESHAALEIGGQRGKDRVGQPCALGVGRGLIGRDPRGDRPCVAQ
jgi:hypothetical protein